MMRFEATSLPFFAVLVSVFGGQHAETTERQELKPLVQEQRASDDPLASLTVILHVDSVQPIARDGLEFSITVENWGDQAVELLDPAQLLSIELQRNDGVRVDLPKPPSEVMANTKDLAGFRRRWEGLQPFLVIDPLTSPPKDSQGKGGAFATLRLEPEEEVTQRIRIPRMLAKPDEYWKEMHEFVREGRRNGRMPPTSPPVIPIRDGTYKLKVSLSLSTGPDGPPTRTMISELVVVRLGRD